MRKISCIILFIVLLSCSNEKNKSTEIAINNQGIDSLSKQQQKLINDSLKAQNPLLILPPDSNYTGDYTDKYNNGIIKFKGGFRFGKRHGQWLSFYPNGLTWSELHYDKGLRQGPNLTYFENGKLRYKGYYKNDVRDSVWFYFDTLGNIAEKVLFKNDLIVKKLAVN